MKRKSSKMIQIVFAASGLLIFLATDAFGSSLLSIQARTKSVDTSNSKIKVNYTNVVGDQVDSGITSSENGQVVRASVNVPSEVKVIRIERRGPAVKLMNP